MGSSGSVTGVVNSEVDERKESVCGLENYEAGDRDWSGCRLRFRVQIQHYEKFVAVLFNSVLFI